MSVRALPARDRLQLQSPLAANRQEDFGSRVGELNRIAGLDQLATALENDKRRLSIEARGETQGAGVAAVEEIGSDRLGDDPPS